ncbi:MAG: hypothetical protein KY475_09300 [Planctomycetes bacterium]|nr:hypothetical protein [Planctomycetota bacterium]
MEAIMTISRYAASAAAIGAALLLAPSIGRATDAPKDATEAEEAIYRELDDLSRIEFIKTPLHLVVEYLRQVHRIPIKFDAKAVKEKKLATDVKVTQNITGKTLREALQLTLREFDMTFVVKDNALVIIPKEASEEKSTEK